MRISPRYLAARQALLVLDNFEHVLEASPSLAELLAAAPAVKALVTSRAPLHIDGEHELPIDPLSEREGVTLFVERARAAGRGLEADETVTEICRRLDNLPLAIELAATRAKLLAPEAMLARLGTRLPLLTGGRRDAPAHQRTLTDTIEWSYELLGVAEQQLLARVSVFAGSFSLTAAEAICDAQFDPLAALVDLSLLKPIGDDRFLMLETIREYACAQLDGSLPDELATRHAQYFGGLAQEAGPHVETHASEAWLDLLAADHANLGAAFDRLLVTDISAAAHAGVALTHYWYVRGHLPKAPCGSTVSCRPLANVGSRTSFRANCSTPPRSSPGRQATTPLGSPSPSGRWRAHGHRGTKAASCA